VIEIPAGCNASHSCTSQTTVADQAKNGLSYPNNLAIAASGNLYITQPGNNQVILLPWNSATGTYRTQTDVGKDLGGPSGVAVDSAGNIYIADTHNNRVLKIAPSKPETGRTEIPWVTCRAVGGTRHSAQITRGGMSRAPTHHRAQSRSSSLRSTIPRCCSESPGDANSSRSDSAKSGSRRTGIGKKLRINSDTTIHLPFSVSVLPPLLIFTFVNRVLTVLRDIRV
jgi:DNA-binding beta-propeller fold protein YncE